MNSVSRKKLIAAIKVGQAHLGWDDSLYRQTLYRLTGKASATRCSLKELEAVKEYMHEAGFPRQSKRHGRRPSVARCRKALLEKIEALLTDAGRPWSYVETMTAHMFKRKKLDWLTTDELTRLMQALIIDAKRRAEHEDNR